MVENKAKRIVKNTGFLYLRTIVSLVVNVFTTRILLEALGASDYGLYNVVGGSIAMLGFISASMSSTTQRFISHAEGSGDYARIIIIFNNALLIHNLLAILSVIILSIAGLFFFNGVLSIPEGKFTDALVIYACLLISTVFSITVVPYEAEINAHEDMLFFSLVGIIDVVLKFGIAFLVLYCDKDKLIIYALLMAIESSFVRGTSQWYCRKHYSECRNKDIRNNYNKSIVKEMLSFTGWNTFLTATGMVGLFGMNLVINHFFGVKLNAAMGIATQLSGVLMGLSLNMVKALTPVLVKSEGGNRRDEMLRISIIGSKFSFLIFSFFAIPILFFLPQILELWLKSVPNWTSCFCMILIITQLLEQLTVVLYQTIIAEGNIARYCIWRSVTNILPLIVSIVIYTLVLIEPYWILINWLIFKGILSGLINIYFAHRNAGLNINKYIRFTISPCIITSIITISFIYMLVSLCSNNSVNIIIILLLSFVISIPIYYYIALNRIERNLIFNRICVFSKKRK